MRVVAYYRVSTARQGRSGLGLDAQRAAVEAYLKQQDGVLLESFTEIESGRRVDRPELAKALALAKACRATLCVAKLDRLARNVAFMSALIKANTDFIACDNPYATKLTLHILAAVAEYELDCISARIKAALAQAKARGRILGSRDPRCQNLTDEHRRKGSKIGAATNRRLSDEFRAMVQPVAMELRAKGHNNSEVAESLNSQNYLTRRGKPWTLFTVSQLLNPKG